MKISTPLFISLLTTFLLFGCVYSDGYENNPIEIHSYPSSLTLKGHVIKDGQPYADRALFVTFTGYYPNIGTNQTFNAGAVTDANGDFTVAASPILCNARRDLQAASTTTTHETRIEGMVIVSGPILAGAVTVSTAKTTNLIPSGICDGYAGPDTEFKAVKDLQFVSLSRAKNSAALVPGWEYTDDTPAFRSGLDAEIVPAQIGVASNDFADVTIGKLTTTAFSWPPTVTYAGGHLSSDNIYFIDYLKGYPMTISAEFDFSNPNQNSAGKMSGN